MLELLSLTESLMPQLMRMVLNESLQALKTRGWEERSVLTARPEAAAHGQVQMHVPGGRGSCVSLVIIRHKEMAAFMLTGDQMALKTKAFLKLVRVCSRTVFNVMVGSESGLSLLVIMCISC